MTVLRLSERLDAAIRACRRGSTIEAEPILVHLLDEIDRASSVYNEIQAEEERQIAKGRGDAHDDARGKRDWITCLETILERLYYCSPTDGAYWRKTWVKIACVAVRAAKAHDRRQDKGS